MLLDASMVLLQAVFQLTMLKEKTLLSGHKFWWDEIWYHRFQEFDSLASPLNRSSVLLKCDDTAVNFFS